MRSARSTLSSPGARVLDVGRVGKRGLPFPRHLGLRRHGARPASEPALARAPPHGGREDRGLERGGAVRRRALPLDHRAHRDGGVRAAGERAACRPGCDAADARADATRRAPGADGAGGQGVCRRLPTRLRPTGPGRAARGVERRGHDARPAPGRDDLVYGSTNRSRAFRPKPRRWRWSRRPRSPSSTESARLSFVNNLEDWPRDYRGRVCGTVRSCRCPHSRLAQM